MLSIFNGLPLLATVAELVYAQDLGSCGATLGSSSLPGRIFQLPQRVTALRAPGRGLPKPPECSHSVPYWANLAVASRRSSIPPGCRIYRRRSGSCDRSTTWDPLHHDLAQHCFRVVVLDRLFLPFSRICNQNGGHNVSNLISPL